jgi:hypothetical protein
MNSDVLKVLPQTAEEKAQQQLNRAPAWPDSYYQLLLQKCRLRREKKGAAN